MQEFYTLAQNCITKFDCLLFNKLKLIHVYLLSLVYILAVYGYGIIPGNSSYLISKNPFVNVFRDSIGGQYNYDSVVVPMLAYFTGLNSSRLTYAILNLFIILIANTLFVYISNKKFGADTAKIFIILFLLNPLSIVLFTWVGSYDSATYFLQVLLFLSSSSPVIFLLGLLGGLNHFPIVMISGISLLLFRAVNREDKGNYTNIFLFMAGLLTGLLALKTYQQHSELGINIDRMSYLKLLSLKHLVLDIWLSNWLALVFSLYNVLWGIVVIIGYFLYSNYKNLLYVFAGSNICFVFFTGLGSRDSTRIFAILSWPLLFYSFLFLIKKTKSKSNISYIELRKYLSALTLIGLLVPRIYLFDGNIYFSNFYILFNIVKRIF
jgi:hypothetical protein